MIIFTGQTVILVLDEVPRQHLLVPVGHSPASRLGRNRVDGDEVVRWCVDRKDTHDLHARVTPDQLTGRSRVEIQCRVSHSKVAVTSQPDFFLFFFCSTVSQTSNS